MVYDGQEDRDLYGDRGYTVYPPLNVTVPSLQDQTDMYWSIYTDDGRGNGELVAYVVDAYRAFLIAYALDKSDDDARMGVR